MAQQGNSTNTKDSHSKLAPETVRGTDLRSKMIQSEEFGEQFRAVRAEHQGQDQVESEVKKDNPSYSNSKESNTREKSDNKQ